VQQQFAEKFPQTPIPHRNAFRKLIEQFRETGSVLDGERSGRQFKVNDKKLMYISDSLLRSASKQRTVNVVQSPTISSDYWRKTESPTPCLWKMALLHTYPGTP
jgi:hypothetical protein